MRKLIFTNSAWKSFVILVSSMLLGNFVIYSFLDILQWTTMISAFIGAMIGSSSIFLLPLKTAINGYSSSIFHIFTMFNNIPILFYRVIEFNEYEENIKDEIKEWCNNQCEDKYVIGPTHVFFRKASDAAMFRLTQ